MAATWTATNDTLTYTLGGDDAASFDFDEATGQIMTMAELDFETKASYTVEITATDDTGESDTVMVTVMVTNVDEMGTVTLSPMEPSPSVGTEMMATPNRSLTTGHDQRHVAVGQFRCHGWDLYRHRGRHVGKLHAGGGGREYVPAGNGDVHGRAWSRQERIGSIGEHGQRPGDIIGHG